MQFKSMDDLLIKIYNIRNIESIEVYDIEVNTTGKVIVVPCLLVFYDGGKVLNLNYDDKYFNTFVKKVVQVYRDEKNNILEDSLTDPFHMRQKIRINDKTKGILESGQLENIRQAYRFYDGKESYDRSLLFQKDTVNLLLPIVKYHLGKVFENTDKNINLEDDFYGYRNNYVVPGTIGGVPTHVLLVCDEVKDNSYSFKIGGLLENSSPIGMHLSFANDRICVQTFIEKYDILCDFVYLVSNGVVKSITNIEKNGVSIYYKNDDLESCVPDLLNIVNLDCDTQFQWFKLPWNAYYGIDSEVTSLSETEREISISNMYLYGTDSSFMKKEYFSRCYKRSDTTIVKGNTVILDETIKNTVGICLFPKDGVYLIETSFLDTLNDNGYYEENMENKYFYHLTKVENGIRSIKRTCLNTLGQSDNILENGDLLNDSLILKLVR